MKGLAIIAAVGILGMHACLATAQEPEYRRKTERQDVHLRNDCRLAVQVLTSGRPANKREWALWRINDCNESGPPVLAHMWRQARADSVSLGEAIYYSVQLRDRRVYDAVSSIARDRTVPPLKRAAALHLLGRWARPGFILAYRQFFTPGYESRPGRAHDVLFVDHDTQVDGAEPLPATLRADVIRLAQDIATTDPDFRLRDAAKLLSSWLS